MIFRSFAVLTNATAPSIVLQAMLDEEHSLQRWHWPEPCQAKQAANLSVIIYEHSAARPPEGMHILQCAFLHLVGEECAQAQTTCAYMLIVMCF
jgi:hypothetical protein